MKSWRSLILAAVVCSGTVMIPAKAEAGPLLDWLRGMRQKCRLNQPNTGCNTCQTGIAQNGLAQANPFNLQPNQCATTCNQTCSRTVVNYVPYTAYRCSYEQVPVTQYKPVTNSDPCTGCSVTCMKPCTTYTWQARQVPYTTYRAVYRTENYTVPVTTISNSGDCATCGVNPQGVASGCPTCNVPGSTVLPSQAQPSTVPQGNIPIYGAPQPGSTYPYPSPGNVIMPDGSTSVITTPGGTVSTTGTYSTTPSGSFGSSPTPADSIPAIQGVNPQSQQRPILDSLRGYNDNTQVNPARNAVMPSGVTLDQVNTRSALRRDWGYSPVRLASYSEPVKQRGTEWTVEPNYAPANLSAVPARAAEPVNSNWRNAGW